MASLARALALALGLALLGLGAGPMPVQAAKPKLDKKAIAALADEWFAARPATRFEHWDVEQRRALLARAAAIDLPEGGFDQALELLWKAVKKHAPKPKGAIETPYGKATWIQKGKGGKRSGLVIGLHGGGEGAGNASEAAGNWGAPGHMGMYPQGVRLVSDTWNTVHGERFVLTLIDIAKSRYQVDPDRVYVMGFSMGGTGSWHMAGRWPDLLAGAVPGNGVLMASPGTKIVDPDDIESMQYGLIPNVRNLPVYFFTGMNDKNCEPGTFRLAWRWIERLKQDDPEGYGHVVFELDPQVAHAFPPGQPSKAIRYVTSKPREPFPKELVWEYAETPYPLPDGADKTTRLSKRWFYWIHCAYAVDQMMLKASYKREGDVLEVFVDPGGADAEDLSVMLNPTMLGDATKVRLTTPDGVHEPVALEPRFDVLLDSLDARLDRRLVFDRRLPLVPQARPTTGE